MKNFFSIITIFFLLLFTNSFVFSQETNFSGVWKINRNKSNLAGMNIKDFTLTIKHEGINLYISSKVIFPGGYERTQEYKYTTDGKDCFIPGRKVKQLTGRCILENGELIIESEADAQKIVGGKEEILIMDVTEKYSLSKNGKTLTILKRSMLENRMFESKMVFERVDKK